MARDYRSDAYRQTLLNELDPHQAYASTANYSMPAPGFGADGGDPINGLLSQYDRRNEGRGGAGSGAAKGAAIGSVVPGIGTAVGAAAGAIGGAFTKNAKSAMTDFGVNDARQAIAQQYQARLGREAHADEITGQLNNVGWQSGDRYVGEMGLRAILESIGVPVEGAAGGSTAGAGSSAPQPPPANSGSGTPAAPAAQGQYTGGSGALVDPYTLTAEGDIASTLPGAQRYTGYDASTGRSGFAGAGGGDGYAYAGFDFGQDPANRDVGKSAKYAWAQVTEQLAREGVPMPRTKAEAEAYAQRAAPKMAALGYQVTNIVGDKMTVQTREGVDTIDFLGDADGANPMMTWQSSLAGGGGMSTPSSGGGTMGPSSHGGMDLTSSALFDQLMRQVRDIAEGKSNGALVTDTNALLQLLAG
jgi:hypothetical protein